MPTRPRRGARLRAVRMRGGRGWPGGVGVAYGDHNPTILTAGLAKVKRIRNRWAIKVTIYSHPLKISSLRQTLCPSSGRFLEARALAPASPSVIQGLRRAQLCGWGFAVESRSPIRRALLCAIRRGGQILSPSPKSEILNPVGASRWSRGHRYNRSALASDLGIVA